MTPSPVPAERMTTRVLRLRLKDKHATALHAMARDVNLVWNYCNELGLKVLEREGRYLSGFDFQKYLNGASKEGLSVGSTVFQQVAEEFARKRRQFKKRTLRWRSSDRKKANYSLGWIPFKARALVYRGGQVQFQGLHLSFWDSYGLSNYELGAGCISEDSRGRWYLNVTVKAKRLPLPPPESVEAIGIDLGLKSFLATSSGTVVEAIGFYRGLEPKIAAAQRAKKWQRVRALHAKAKNRRKDRLHKLSTALVKEHGALFVGDVNAAALAKTRAAKSVNDAGWSAFRTMLSYKCDYAGRWFKEVDERFTTQDCSACGSRAGPKGQEGLDTRRWVCSACKAMHDRDINAARNIRARGLAWLSEKFSTVAEAPAYETTVNEAVSAAAVGHDRPTVGIVDCSTRMSKDSNPAHAA